MGFSYRVEQFSTGVWFWGLDEGVSGVLHERFGIWRSGLRFSGFPVSELAMYPMMAIRVTIYDTAPAKIPQQLVLASAAADDDGEDDYGSSTTSRCW